MSPSLWVVLAAMMVGQGAPTSNPDIALILDVAGGAAAVDAASGTPSTGGAHDPPRRGFGLQELELSMGANVDPFLRLDSNLVFSLFGVELEEAYGTTLALPGGLQVRAGQFLTRFGRVNPTHPHSWHFLHQPLVLGRLFGPEGHRGLGTELSWMPALPWFLTLSASVVQEAGTEVQELEDLTATLRLEQFFDLSRSWSLLFGLSGHFADSQTGPGNRREVYGADLYLRWRPPGSADRAALSLQVEVVFRSEQVPKDTVQDGGGYAELVWNLDPSWELGGRHEHLRSPGRDRTQLALTWYPSHFSRLRLQGSRDRDEAAETTAWMAHLGLEVLIGAHGAHGF